ncbi:UNVERIFIED_CONTAM: hypothetical protein GTU68_036087 [Idotea baltica]|nr:hypothetical protein [Idotea baltica]
MLSKSKIVEEELKKIICLENADDDPNNYDWIADYEDINFWNFLSVNYLELDRFFTLLDIETGPNSGWEKFVEALGLSLWEDRKWCFQYHNGVGPTRAALIKLLDSKKHDQDLNLSVLLELLKEMDRYDILLQIDWLRLIEKYKGTSKSSFKAKEVEAPLIFQLNLVSEQSKADILQSESISFSSYEEVPPQDLNTKNALKEKSKKKKSSDVCILMSYARDAESYAKRVANELRSDLWRNKKIKIVMLGDPDIKRKLIMDTSNTLHKWFNQVQYVVPVLSPQYLKQIQNLDTTESDQEAALLNRLVYKFTLDQYVSFGSRNRRCRPLCPNAFAKEVRSSSVVKGSGLFLLTWPCSDPSQVRDFAITLAEKPLLP